jgi:hypothetical protein
MSTAFNPGDAITFTTAGRGASGPRRNGVFLSLTATPQGAWVEVREDGTEKVYRTRLGQIAAR